MAFEDRVKQLSKSSFSVVATATVAALATLDGKNSAKEELLAPSVATVAEVAVATVKKKENGDKARHIQNQPINKKTVIFNGQGCKTTGRFIEVEFNQADPAPKTDHERPSCFSCHHYDGRGSAWPGLCRLDETAGIPAVEINFDVVDVANGCKDYVVSTRKRKATSEIKLCGDDPGYVPGTRGKTLASQGNFKEETP